LLGLSEFDKGLPGKLMGYACYGECKSEILSWLRKNHYFFHFCDGKRNFINTLKIMWGFPYEYINTHHPLMQNIAACLQSELEEAVINFIKKYQEKTQAKYLYYAGGVALNIKLNSRLINNKIFADVFIPPPANDSGLGIGAASYVNWRNGKSLDIHNPFMNNWNIEPYQYNPEFSIEKLCRQLANDRVIGICVGNAEAGPRALGHRSILANPSRIRMRDYVSRVIKKREWYRPLAPIVLESEMENIFYDYSPNHLMKYMLYDFKVKNKVREKIPAVIHADGSARAQIVYEKDKTLMLISEILHIMRDKYSIPCLINTSFNTAGQPIVHQKMEALETGKKMGLDGIVMDNEYINLRDNV